MFELDAELHLMDPVCVLTAGAAGPRLFTIHQIDANTNNLPKAHTWCVLNAFCAHINTHKIFVTITENNTFQSLIASFM